jgi:hypothetical protein
VCAQLRDNGQWSGELHHICKDGRKVIVDSRMQLLDDTVLEVNRDITDRKQIENVLGETEQRNKGQVSLKWVHGADRELVLRWTETGGPQVEPPTRTGFGSRVIVGMIEQLKGTVRFNWHPTGLVCEISIRV